MQLNQQPIEKRIIASDGTLEIQSLFHTIQGEGPFAGKPAFFIRLAGCNLQCPGCDTDYTTGRGTSTPAELARHVMRAAPQTTNLVVITGGEPFRQNITALCVTLQLWGYIVQVETNGTLPPSPDLPDSVMVVCSPKAGKLDKEMAKRADCYKYVMDQNSIDPEDGLPVLALDHSAKPRVARPPEGFKGAIYLQPMDRQDPVANKHNQDACVFACLVHGYTLQLQIHKIVGVD